LSGILPVSAVLAQIGGTYEASALCQTGIAAIARGLADARPSRYFWGMDLVGGMAGALAVAVSIYRLFSLDGCLPVIASLVSLLESGGKQVGSNFIWSQPAVSSGPDEALCGISHGQAGCALALAEAATVENLPSEIRKRANSLAQRAISWELGQFRSEVKNFPDFRHRARYAREGEIAWSHGALGTTYALHRIRACIEAPAVDAFIAAFSIADLMNHAITHRPGPTNASLCHGALGVFHLTSELLRFENNKGLREMLQQVARWTGLAHWAEFESRALRQHAIDPAGCMVGRAGSFIGWLALRHSSVETIPFLPHLLEVPISSSTLPGKPQVGASTRDQTRPLTA